MEIWNKIFLKFMTIILIGAFCVSCDHIKKSEVTIVENKNIIIKNLKVMLNIFLVIKF